MIEYLELLPEDVETVAELAERHLTHGEAVKEDIRRKSREGRYFGVKAVRDGKIVGFYSYTDHCVEFTVPHPALERRIRELTGDSHVVTSDALYLDSGYQHRGIATELSLRLSARARSRGVRYMVTELWTHPDGRIPALKALLHNGEVVMTETVPMFYAGMEERGMECPICGRGCQCGAQVMVQRLREAAASG